MSRFVARSTAGEGPRTLGLDAFIEETARGRAVETFSVRTDDRRWLALLDSGGQVVAVTAVVRDPGLEKRRDQEWDER